MNILTPGLLYSGSRPRWFETEFYSGKIEISFVRTEGFTDLRPGITQKTRSPFISGNIVCDYMLGFGI